MGLARRGQAWSGEDWLGKARAVNSVKGSVSNGGFSEADSFTGHVSVRSGTAGPGTASPGKVWAVNSGLHRVRCFPVSIDTLARSIWA